jgi:MFS family permease
VSDLTPLKRAKSLNRLLANAFFGSLYGPIIGVGGAVFTGYALWMGLQASDIALLSSVTLLAGLVYPFSAMILGAVKRKKPFLVGGGLVETFLLVAISFVPLLAAGATARFFLLAGFVLASTLAANALGPLFTSWVSTIIPEETRARFISRQSVLGTVTGMAITFVVARYIDRTGGASYFSFLLPFLFALAVGWGRYLVFLAVPFPRALEAPAPALTPLGSMVGPLKQRGFRRLLIFNLAIAFGASVADPFYNVYMLQNLAVSYSFIAVLTIVGSLVGIASWFLWGRISPKLGNKPVIAIGTFLRALLPFLWLFATPTNYVPVLILINILSAVMGPGLTLGITTLQYEIVPEGPGRSAYFAAWAFIHSVLGVAMTSAGALLARLLAHVHFTFLGLAFDNLKVIFALSGLLLIVPLTLLAGVPVVRTRGRALPFRQVFRGNPVAFAYNAMLFTLLRNTGTRARAIEGMGHSRSPMAMDTLVTALADPDPRIRRAAARALGGSGSEEAVQLLTEELASEESPIRLEACEALGGLKAAAAVPPLVRLLDAHDARLAATAARALAEIGSEGTADLLAVKLAACPPGERIVRLSIFEALSHLQDARMIVPALASLPLYTSSIIRLQIQNSVCRALGAGNAFYEMQGQEHLRLAKRLYRIQKALRRYLPRLVPLRRLLALDAIDELAHVIEEGEYGKIPELALFLADTVEWRKVSPHPGFVALRGFCEAHRGGFTVRPEIFSFVCLEKLFEDELRDAPPAGDADGTGALTERQVLGNSQRP